MKAAGLAVLLYRGGWRIYRVAEVVDVAEDLPEGDGAPPEEGEKALLLVVRDGVLSEMRLHRGKLELDVITAPLVVEAESEGT